jgi:Kef-type K+ transport system membrane component KefB
MSRDLVYLLLIFGLLVVPRALQRLRLPAPITSLLLGLGATLLWGEETHDPVVVLLSALGISSLFLFAGLEVDWAALRRGVGRLLLHLGIRIAALAGTAWLAWRYLDLGWQAASLVALALLTPSTGFILDTLERMGLDPEERFWVTNKAIAGELLALAVLFVALLAGNPVQLGLSSLAMLALVVGLPLLFLALGRWVVPHAPGSEFSLLVMVGMVAAYVTFRLGVYYLVGAFIAGLTARQLRQRMPNLASHDNIHALRLFASFFVPFYFFHAGTGISRDALSLEAMLLGLAITAVVLPLRVGVAWLQRRWLFRDSREGALRVSVAMAPTLVFTLVLAQVLHARFDIPGALFGGLVLYTVLNTLLPSLLLKQTFDIDPLDPPAVPHPEDALDPARLNPEGNTPPSSPPGPS